MAHRWEKETNGKYALVIDGWDTGMGSSPETGLALLSQTSLEIPGEVSAGWPLTAQTVSGATLSHPTYGCVDYSVLAGTGSGTYTYYMLDSSGQAFGSTGGGTWVSLGNTTTGASATVQGIVVWHNYIFIMRNDKIDYAATSSPSSWTSGWDPSSGGTGGAPLTGTTYHTAIVAQNNDVVYICNGSKIASLAWNGGSAFDPTSTSTYTFNASALLLPFDEQSVCLATLGTNLMIGGITNRIYPWDRTSATYGAPLLLPETYVWRMVNANNFLFIFMGRNLSRGRIYVTSGSAINEFFKMPDFLANSVEPYWLWGDAIWWRNYLLFTAIPYQNSGDTLITTTSSNVWALKLGVTILGASEQNFSGIGRMGSTQLGTVLLPNAKNTASGGWDFYVGCDDLSGTSYQIQTSFNTASNSISAVVDSDIIPVGTSITPKTFSQIEFKLSTPLTTSETVTVYVRSNLSASFTSLGVLNTTGIISPTAPFSFSLEKLQWIQVELVILGQTNGSHGRVTEVRIR